jgi:hypothetical protein
MDPVVTVLTIQTKVKIKTRLLLSPSDNYKKI